MAKAPKEATQEEVVVTEEVAVDETVVEATQEEVVAAKKYIGGEQVAHGVRYVSTGRFRCPLCGNGYNADVNDVISGEAISCGCDK